MSNKTLFIVLNKDMILENHTTSENIDVMYAEKENIDKLLRYEKLVQYDCIIIGLTPLNNGTLKKIIEMLNKNDVVYVPMPKPKKLLHRIIRKIQRVLMKLFMPDLPKDEPIIIAFNSDLIKNRKIVGIGKHCILYNLLAKLGKNSKIKCLEIANVDASSSLTGEISRIWDIICLGKETGELYRLIKFALVGLSGIFVNEFFLWYLTEFFDIYYFVSSIIAIEISILSNFTLNDLWTFRDRRKPGKMATMHRLLKYNIISWSTGSINWFVLVTLKEFFGVYYLIANIIGIFVAFIGNFILSSLWAWKKY